MLVSMTGYGQTSVCVDSVSYSLEIKSLNGKHFKASIKVPELLSYHEPRIEQLLREKLVRGSIVFSLRLRDTSEQAAWEVNAGAIKGYIQSLKEAAALVGESAPVQINLASVLMLPGVCQTPEPDEELRKQQWQIIEDITGKAMDQVIEMRTEEGKALHADMVKHCGCIAEALLLVRELAPGVVEDYAERLRARVQNLISKAELELREDDLIREVAVFAERADINEELARIDSHMKQFSTMMENGQNVGRKLEFLTQEMLREANTIGSKANDAEIAHHVVEIKGHIDRIKEQVMNVV